MKVRAKMMGYYLHKRRREGVVFDLVTVKKKHKDGKIEVITPEKQFSENWMEKFVTGQKKEEPVEESSEEGEEEKTADLSQELI